MTFTVIYRDREHRPGGDQLAKYLLGLMGGNVQIGPELTVTVMVFSPKYGVQQLESELSLIVIVTDCCILLFILTWD